MLRRSLLASLAVSAVAFNPSRAQETWRVGVNPGGAPFSFRDAQSGADQGVSVELIRVIGQQAGVSIQFLAMAFTELIPALTSSRIDVIAANVLATPERAALVEFSEPVVKGGDGLVVSIIDWDCPVSVALAHFSWTAVD